MSVDEFVESTINGLEKDALGIGVGSAVNLMKARDNAFNMLNPS